MIKTVKEKNFCSRCDREPGCLYSACNEVDGCFLYKRANDYKWAYEQKYRFVKMLSDVYKRELLDIEEIEYYKFDSCEVVKIRHIDGYSEYINVTMNSIEAIGKDIAIQICTHNVPSLIDNPETVRIIEDLIKIYKRRCAEWQILKRGEQNDRQ